MLLAAGFQSELNFLQEQNRRILWRMKTVPTAFLRYEQRLPPITSSFLRISGKNFEAEPVFSK